MKHICTKFVAMLLVIAMIAGVLPFAFAANVGPFTDVKDTDWFASNVQYVYDNGLMNGTTTTTFEPESNLTRAQTAMVLSSSATLRSKRTPRRRKSSTRSSRSSRPC